MHKSGYTHWDIKPSNLLLDEISFDLKISDFGGATEIAGPNRDGKLSEYVGTSSYMAPEILMGVKY